MRGKGITVAELEASVVPLNEVKLAVERIEQIAEVGDDEMAHSREDDLHQAVLEYLARNAPGPWCAYAREALKTQAIDFARWCA